MRKLLLAAAVLVLACGSPAGPFGGPEVVADVKDNHVNLHNKSSARVFYFVIGQAAVAYTNWVPCVASNCASLDPGNSVSVAFPRPSIPASEKNAIVHWWLAVPDGTGSKPGPVQSFIVPLY